MQPNGTSVDTIHAVIHFGWRIQVNNITEDMSGLPNVNCTFGNPVGTADGTIDCVATGDAPVTGDFNVAIITLDAAEIGLASIDFDRERTAATGDGSSVLRNTFRATVNVQGLIVELDVALQAVPASGHNVVFDVKLYGRDVFGPATADMPWLIFNASPIRSFTNLVGTADQTGAKFTVLVSQIRLDVYDITIVAKRDGGLKDTLVNLRDDVNIDRPRAELGSINMGTLLKGNAMDNPRGPTVEPASIVNALDASLLAAAFSTSETNPIQVFGGDVKRLDPRVDFDRDGDVDEDDFELLKANYLKFSPVILVFPE